VSVSHRFREDESDCCGFVFISMLMKEMVGALLR